MASTTKKSANHASLTEDVAEALQCPVCYEMPHPPIHQCERGHHLCGNCRKKLPTCPLCKGRFSGARNYVAEELVVKLEGLCDKTTRRNSGRSLQCRQNYKRVGNMYYCLVSGCGEDSIRSFKATMNHIRQHHSDILHELKGFVPNCYTQAWELTYESDQIYQNILHLSSMGLFVFTLDVRSNGDLFAWVQMVATPEVASRYKYKIKVFDVSGYKRKTSFTDEVASSLDTWRDIIGFHRCLVVSCRDMKSFTWDCDSFGCLVEISRIEDEEEDDDYEDSDVVDDEVIDSLCEDLNNCLRRENLSVVDEEIVSQSGERNGSFHNSYRRRQDRGRSAVRVFHSRGRYNSRYRRGNFDQQTFCRRGRSEGSRQWRRQQNRSRARCTQRNQCNFSPRNGSNQSPHPPRGRYRPYFSRRGRRSYRESTHSDRSSSEELFECDIDMAFYNTSNYIF